MPDDPLNGDMITDTSHPVFDRVTAGEGAAGATSVDSSFSSSASPPAPAMPSLEELEIQEVQHGAARLQDRMSRHVVILWNIGLSDIHNDIEQPDAYKGLKVIRR